MLSDYIGYDAKRKKFYSLLNVQRDKRVKCFANSREEAEQVFLANEFPREALIAAAEHALPVLEHERRKKRIRRYVNRKKLEEKAAPLWT
jgi:hypothetical protein